MNLDVGRRGFCAAVAMGSLAGCLGVMAKERTRVMGVRSGPPTERTKEIELAPGDRIILEYRPTGSGTSRIIVEDPAGEVMFDETLAEQGAVRYEATTAGVHTVRFTWGVGARIDMYHEF